MMPSSYVRNAIQKESSAKSITNRKTLGVHPDGYYHDRITCACVWFVGLCALPIVNIDIDWYLMLVIGCGAGLLLTPDLDQSVQVNAIGNFGRLVALPFFWSKPISTLVRRFASGVYESYWAVYASVMAHRGWSHTPVVGTIGRLAYLFPLIFAAHIYLGWNAEHYPLLICFAIGLCIADFGHWLRDNYGIQI